MGDEVFPSRTENQFTHSETLMSYPRKSSVHSGHPEL